MISLICWVARCLEGRVRLGSQLVLSRYRTSIVVLVLKHGSRNMEGVYLKSPEIKNVSNPD